MAKTSKTTTTVYCTGNQATCSAGCTAGVYSDGGPCRVTCYGSQGCTSNQGCVSAQGNCSAGCTTAVFSPGGVCYQVLQ